MTDFVFSVQDDSGTVYQLTMLASPGYVVSAGDQGLFAGVPDNGTDGTVVPSSIEQAFAVAQVLDDIHFSITSTPDTLLSSWPRSGTVTWTSGANIGLTTDITQIDAANAYVTAAECRRYLASRGNALPGTVSEAALQAAIVQATDYIDQRYRFKGVKRVQKYGADLGATAGAIFEPWLASYSWGIRGSNVLVPSTTPQVTEWPRQGVVDFSGDTISGIPSAVKAACAELAFRQAAGTVLQPDYDPNIVTAGGVLQSSTDKVGPIERVRTYDTKLGLGFFPTIPQVTRILSKAGLLSPSGGRTVMR